MDGVVEYDELYHIHKVQRFYQTERNTCMWKKLFFFLKTCYVLLVKKRINIVEDFTYGQYGIPPELYSEYAWYVIIPLYNPTDTQ